MAPCDVNRILTAHTGFEGRRTSQSIICKSCYDFYRNLISGCSEESTDEHLQLLLSHLNTCSGNDTTTNVTIQVITQVGRVGKQLLDNHAVLLSQVYDDFVKRLHNKGLELVPSKRWLLAEIVTHLSQHVELCCKIQKLGTMTYRSGGDILYALSHALGQAKRETGAIFHNALVLNKHVQDTAAKFISCYRDNPDAFASTSNSIDSFVSKVHPDLWRFLQI